MCGVVLAFSFDTLAGIIVEVSFRTIFHSIEKKMCIDQGAFSNFFVSS